MFLNLRIILKKKLYYICYICLIFIFFIRYNYGFLNDNNSYSDGVLIVKVIRVRKIGLRL